jgi:hypothetical protein
MRPSFIARWLCAAFAVLLFAAPGLARAQSAFSNEQLAQTLAPIALYPDALLSQVLMAATYPSDVAEAAAWVKANPKQNGDAAVKAVANQPWDPSVQSLVAFPDVLLQMGDNPKWVKDVGDAFLAEPERVLDQVQVLRRRAYDAGNLKTTEQQKIVVQPAAAAPAPAAGAPVTNVTQQTIIIEPAQPQVVFVPTYNPTVVFGTWMYPSFPPVYFPPPPGAVFGNALLSGIAFGTGIAITNALWGGFNWGWGRSNVNINVNRFNNINVNRPLNVNQNNVAWNHNPANRRDVPYRDAQVRQRFDSERVTANNNRLQGGGGNAGAARDQYRGRDVQRNASREQAQAALQNRGVDVSQSRDQLRNDPQTRDRAQAAAQNANRDRAGGAGQNANRDRAGPAAQNLDRNRASAAAQNVDRDRARQAAQNVDRDQARQTAQNVNRDAARPATSTADRDRARAAAQNADRERAQQAAQNRSRDNALSGAGDGARSRQAADRGQASREAMQNRGGNASRPSPGAGGGGGDRAGARAAAGGRAGGGGAGGGARAGGGPRGR